MNNVPHHITQHVTGKRFRAAFERWKQCELTGEVFKANIGRTRPRVETSPDNSRRQKRRGAADQSDDGNDDTKCDDSDNDSLSDLYPVEYFGKLGIAGSRRGETEMDADNGCETRDKVSSANSSVNSQSTNVSGQYAANTSSGAVKNSSKVKRHKKPTVLKTCKSKRPKL